MKTRKLGILGLMAGLLGVTSKTEEREIIRPPQPKVKPVTKRQKTTGWRRASMPEYYGFRKQEIWAEKPNGERVQISVKNCLKKGFKMLTLPNA